MRTALAVHLDHAHVTRRRQSRRCPRARRARRWRCAAARRSLGQLDEGPERGRLDDLADVLVATLDLLQHHRTRSTSASRARRWRVDQHLAVVVDVDWGLELLPIAHGWFPALADQRPIWPVDLDVWMRGANWPLLARPADHGTHLAEDEFAGGRYYVSASRRIEGNAGILMSI